MLLSNQHKTEYQQQDQSSLYAQFASGSDFMHKLMCSAHGLMMQRDYKDDLHL